jgi:cytochrome c oxidase assembly factor CtaG/putative copper export protein
VTEGSRTGGNAGPRTGGEAARPDGPARTARLTQSSALPLYLLAGVVLGSLALVLTGAAAPTVVGDSGPLGRWGLPTAKFLFNTALTLTIGALVLAVGVLPRTQGRRGDVDPDWVRLLTIGQVASSVLTVSSVAVLVFTYVDTAGAQAYAGDFSAQLWSFITAIDLGRLWLGITALAAVANLCVFAFRSFAGVAVALAASLVPIGLLALLGHSAEASGHTQAVGSLAVHLVGVVLWAGGLLSLALLAPGLTRRPDLGTLVSRYSTLALIAFLLVMYSGFTNGSLRVRSLSDWWGTPYGRVLLAKLALTLLLGLIGWMHRRSVIGGLAGSGVSSGPAAGRGASALFWRLVLVEAAVFGAVSGLGVVLSRTAPPVPDEPPAEPTAAELLTGEPLPPPPDWGNYFTEWRVDPIWVVITVGATVLYLLAVRRLRVRGDSWSTARTICWVAGMAVLFYITSGGVSVYGHVLFSGHMIQHMALVMVAPVPMVMGAPVTLLMRALRPRQDGSRGLREWVLVLVHSRYARFWAHPIVAAVNFAGSLVVFYHSGIMIYALETHAGHEIMIVHFLLAGYMFVQSIIGIDPGVNRFPYPVRLLVLLVTMAFHAFFGISIMSGEALIAGEWYGNMGHGWGFSALEDQVTGGEIAWGIGELPTLSVAILLAAEWFTSSTREARRRDRSEARTGDAELSAYNAMLQQLADRDQAGSSRPRR